MEKSTALKKIVNEPELIIEDVSTYDYTAPIVDDEPMAFLVL